MTLAELESLETQYRLALNALEKIEYHEGYPYYPQEIRDFMNWLIQPPWGDTSYDPSQVTDILSTIDTATINQIRCVLTAANRAERFSDGVWLHMLENRQLDPVFKRLRDLISW